VAIGSALLTDHYELTMVQAALASGVAQRNAVFEVFARSLPPGRRYGVVAGLGRLVDLVEGFRFTPEDLDYLGRFLDAPTCEWLAGYRFTGRIDAYREGELYFTGSPVLTVEASFAEAVVLETLVLSVLNHDSAVASAAARMDVAAGDRTLIEMGGRRTDEWAAVHAARAAWIAGFDATSNLEAGRSYGIPTAGTVSHAFILAHDDEVAAFEAQVVGLGPTSTLLVDTYDTDDAISRAVDVAGTELGAIRIDSGDLLEATARARELLDELGATGTKIVLSGDLDEHALQRLAACPADAYGVGTSVVTGSGHPTAGFVYKLVAVDGRPVEKRSTGKATTGCRKHAVRVVRDGVAVAELLRPSPFSPAEGRALQVEVMAGGEVRHRPTLFEVRAHHLAARAELPPDALSLDDGPPALAAVLQ